jgi:hypothetical protein
MFMPARSPTPINVLVIAAIFLLLCGAAAAQSAPAIVWRVKNPFRFIAEQAVMDQITAVHNGGAKTAFELEHALQKIDLAGAKPRGWWSVLAANSYEKTCWDATKLEFRTVNKCEDYLAPKSHQVLVRLENAEALAGQRCEWYMDGSASGESDCGDEIELRIPYDTYHPENNQGVSVSARVAGGAEVPEVPVKVEDKLIVGLGDSYASGEGNPDVPANFSDGVTDTDSPLFSSTGLPTPQKNAGPAAAAQWLDRRCHRSTYSYQFKTALQVALSDPHWAVTFVTYSCSGAVTAQVVMDEQKKNDLPEHENPREKPDLMNNSVYKIFPPQIKSLKKAICENGDECSGESGKQRKIDYLMLSIGGNDVKFAKYVANLTLSSTSWLTQVAKLVRKTKKPAGDTIKAIAELTQTYSALRDTLVTDLNIAGCKKGAPCPQILLTPYPNPLNDENGDRCIGERGEFKVPFGRDRAGRRAERIKDTHDVILFGLRQVQLNTGPDGQGSPLWSVVTDQLKKYDTHGFCAQDKSSAAETAELLTIPVRKKINGQRQWVYRSPDSRWLPFDYTKYRGYEPRQRWLRLPVDSKLNIDEQIPFFNLEKDWFFIDEIAGIMHPTAEGLAETADANSNIILQLEGKR